MLSKTLLTAFAIIFAGAVSAQAPANPVATPKIDQRQNNQQQRIYQGVASGQLTQKETENLEKRESKIAAHKALAKADGKVTHTERKHLLKEENRASKAIYRQKRDRQPAVR